MGRGLQVSAFGVVHKAVTDKDDPAMKAPVTRAPGKVDAAAIRGKLRPFKLEALKAAKKL